MTNHTQLSKFLALILRHKADKFHLKLDEQGFGDVQDVLKIIENRFGDTFQYDDLLQVVAGDKHGKKRYEIVDGKIRAMFGHSNVREVQYPIATPPQHLYHGTSKDAIESIRKIGLQAQSRQYVHLTTNLDNAKRVAHRHSKHTIVLQIDALTAHPDGVVFHQPETEHFLCKHIPPQYIDFDNITDSIE